MMSTERSNKLKETFVKVCVAFQLRPYDKGLTIQAPEGRSCTS